MSLGLSNLANDHYLNQLYQQSKTARQRNNVNFNNVIAAKMVDSTTKTQISFEEMLKSKYPGAYYHVMDGSKISQAAWDRNDFPYERFYSDSVDESILDWKPSGAEPAANSPEVQSRRSSVVGQKSIIVHPALEEKMKSDPELAEKVMAKVENFIATYPAVPGCGYLIELDENGEIGKYLVTGPVTVTVSSSEFVEERKAREAKHAEYERIAEENALKRKLLEQAWVKKGYQRDIINKAISKYETTLKFEEGEMIVGTGDITGTK